MEKTFIILLAVTLISCGSSSQTTNINLMNGHYTVSELNGQEITTQNPTITFDLNENRVYGYSGCNNFNGSFTVENNNITFGPIAATKKMCMDNSSEDELFKILQGTKTFSVENNTLTLSEVNGTLLKAQISDSTKTMQDKKITFDYNATSRGMLLNIVISNEGHYLAVTKVRGMKPAKQTYTEEEWNQLISALETITLNSLPDLSPPSKHFQIDGDAMATLTDYIDGETYKTPIFDHGNPPKEISKLVNLLLSFADRD